MHQIPYHEATAHGATVDRAEYATLDPRELRRGATYRIELLAERVAFPVIVTSLTPDLFVPGLGRARAVVSFRTIAGACPRTPSPGGSIGGVLYDFTPEGAEPCAFGAPNFTLLVWVERSAAMDRNLDVSTMARVTAESAP